MLKRKYPWYDSEFLDPVPTVATLEELTKHDRVFARSNYDTYGFYYYDNPLVKLAIPPTANMFKLLPGCILEYGVIRVGDEWFAVIGNDNGIPLSSGELSVENILIHSHSSREGNAKDGHFPYPSYFDTIQEKGPRQFLASRLGLIEYHVLDPDKDEVYDTNLLDYTLPRLERLKLARELLTRSGVIKSVMKWHDLDDKKFDELISIEGK